MIDECGIQHREDRAGRRLSAVELIRRDKAVAIDVKFVKTSFKKARCLVSADFSVLIAVVRRKRKVMRKETDTGKLDAQRGVFESGGSEIELR